jgi:hypothetical protein
MVPVSSWRSSPCLLAPGRVGSSYRSRNRLRRSWDDRPGAALVRYGPFRADDPGPLRQQSHCPGHRPVGGRGGRRPGGYPPLPLGWAQTPDRGRNRRTTLGPTAQAMLPQAVLASQGPSRDPGQGLLCPPAHCPDCLTTFDACRRADRGLYLHPGDDARWRVSCLLGPIFGTSPGSGMSVMIYAGRGGSGR